MSKRWYRVLAYRPWPSPVTVLDETDKTLLVHEPPGRAYRVRKDGGGATYVPTWAEARAMIIARRESDLVSVQRRLEVCQRALADAESIPPEEP